MLLGLLSQTKPGGLRRFRPPPMDPRLAERRTLTHAAAGRQGIIDPRVPGRGDFRHAGPEARGPAPAGKAPGLVELEFLPGEQGTQLGNMFFEPGRKTMLQFDPHAGVLLHRGQRIELGLSPSQVHDPTEMGTFLAGYTNNDFIHERIAPVVPVRYDEDDYAVLNQSLAYLPAKVKTDDDADAAQLPFGRTLTRYKVQRRRIAFWLPDSTLRQVTNTHLNLRYVMANRAARVIHLDIELDDVGASGLLTTSANWNANNRLVLAANYQWGGPAGIGPLSNPIADIRTIINASAEYPSGGCWLNQRLAGLFLDHPKVRDYFRTQIGDQPLNSAVKAVQEAPGGVVNFAVAGLCEFHVAAAKVSETASSAPDFIMPNDTAVLVRIPAGVPTSGEDISSAQTFRLEGPAGVGFYTREFYMGWKGGGGTMVIVEEASIGAMTAPLVGGIITGAYQ